MQNSISWGLGIVLEYFINTHDVPMCQEPGCDNGSILCWYMANDDDEVHEYFCPIHAGQIGFCPHCGLLLENEIEFGNLCNNCQEQTDQNESDEFDDDQVNYDQSDYPSEDY